MTRNQKSAASDHLESGHILVVTLMMLLVAFVLIVALLRLSSDHAVVARQQITSYQLDKLTNSALAAGDFMMHKKAAGNDLFASSGEIYSAHLANGEMRAEVSSHGGGTTPYIITLRATGKTRYGEKHQWADYHGFVSPWQLDAGPCVVIFNKAFADPTGLIRAQAAQGGMLMVLQDGLSMTNTKRITLNKDLGTSEQYVIQGGLHIRPLNEVAPGEVHHHVTVAGPLVMAGKCIIEGDLTLQATLAAQALVVTGDLTILGDDVQIPEATTILGDVTIPEGYILPAEIAIAGQLIGGDTEPVTVSMPLEEDVVAPEEPTEPTEPAEPEEPVHGYALPDVPATTEQIYRLSIYHKE